MNDPIHARMTTYSRQVLISMRCICHTTLLCKVEGEASYTLGVHQIMLEKSRMFNSFLSLRNLLSSIGLVNISASWSSVPTLSMQISLFYWWSLMKLCLMSMCLVFKYCTGLLVSFTTLSLSHSNGTCLNFISKSFNVAFIHRNCAQQLLALMYSASVVESSTLFCFFEDHDISDLPSSWHVPLVLFLSTLQPA